MELKLNDANYLVYRNTPWDTVAFGFNTNEILHIVYEDESSAVSLLERFEDLCQEQQVRLSYFKVDAQDFVLKRIIQASGYYFAEASFNIRNSRLQLFKDKFNPDRLQFEPADASHVGALQEIVSNDFHYSRFHEDDYIDHALSTKRYFNWIGEIIKNKQELYVALNKGKIVGFHAQQIDVETKTANLILTGTNKANSLLSLALWEKVIVELTKRDIKVADTVVSAANISVLNMYWHFNFNITKTNFDFHKIRNI